MSTNDSWELWQHGAKIKPIEQQLQITLLYMRAKTTVWSRGNGKKLSSKANMAQPPDFVNDKHKRMMRAHDKRITELQKECDKLKGDIEECHAKMRKLQRQLMNGDVHQGRYTLWTSDFDLHEHSNQDIIARFCKNKLFSHHKFLHPSWKDYSPSDKNSLSYKCNKEIDVLVTEDSEFFWINKMVPMINKNYCKIRANINSSIKGEYFGE
jgi:hypothetical protein